MEQGEKGTVANAWDRREEKLSRGRPKSWTLPCRG